MTKSEEDFIKELGLIYDDIEQHELEIRNIEPQRGPVFNRRKQLAKELFNEQGGASGALLCTLRPVNNIIACKNVIDKCETELSNFTCTKEVKEKALANLAYIEMRINRINCETEADVKNTRELLKKIGYLQGGSSVEVNEPEKDNNTQPSEQSQIPTNQEANQEQPTMISLLHEFQRMFAQGGNNTAQFNKTKIYKWNIKFNGEKQADVFEFLRTIKSKAQANQVSDAELFNSASEFFCGFAAKWFYSQTFANWNDMKRKLISDFVQVNYFDELLDTIRQRRQSPNESIVHFFTVFEDDCSRLSTRLDNAEKVKIIKKNVLQKYRPYIALGQFQTVEELKHALKVLEATMPQNNFQEPIRFKRFDSGDRLSHGSNVQTNRNEHQSRFEKYSENKEVNRNRSNSNNPFYSNASRNNSRENIQRNNSNGRYSRENSQNRSTSYNQPFRNSSGASANDKTN